MSPVAAMPGAETRPSTATLRLALLGNPNTGKTTLFNALCGARAKTSNFPGTTTTIRRGRVESAGGSMDVLDLPGIYDLDLDAPESAIARSAIDGTTEAMPDVIVAIVDACNLARNLVLVAQLLERGRPLVVALNMIDLATRRGAVIDRELLETRLGVPVITMVARTGVGIDQLRRTITQLAEHGLTPTVAPAQGPQVFRWAQSVATAVLSGADPSAADPRTERLDRVLTHPVWGLAIFAAVMGVLFWVLFALATVPMDLIETTFAELGALIEQWLPPGPVRELLAQGVVGGIAGTVVFLPQICLLFFLITLLEDTGYLARAAFVMDRWLSRFGLPGHAFVPLLTAHACALPGIMSTRLIPDRRDRLATILVAPFMSCSARLPVYVLLTTLLFADRPALAGLAFAGCYLLGALAALVTAKLFGSTILRGQARPMILELPSYKRPSLRNALFTARDQGLSFLSTAGTVIVAICVVMWWLSAYPQTDPPPRAAELRAQAGLPGVSVTDAQALEAEAASLETRSAQAGSFAGRLGRSVAPAFAPLGFDWQLTVGVLTSFLAREVFVSTMSVLAAGQAATDVDAGVVSRIRGMTRDDGRPVFTPATAASALVFFVLAMQCMATLTITRKETGSLKYSALQLGYMSGLAYVAALLVHQGLRAAGVA